MKWARNGMLSDDGCAMLIERSTTKGNARTSRALGRRPVGGGLEEAFDSEDLVIPLAHKTGPVREKSASSWPSRLPLFYVLLWDRATMLLRPRVAVVLLV